MGLGKLPCSLMNCTYLAVWNSEYFSAQCPRSRLNEVQRQRAQHKPWSAPPLTPLIISCRGLFMMSLTKHSECAPLNVGHDSTLQLSMISVPRRSPPSSPSSSSSSPPPPSSSEPSRSFREGQRADLKLCIESKFQVHITLHLFASICQFLFPILREADQIFSSFKVWTVKEATPQPALNY